MRWSTGYREQALSGGLWSAMMSSATQACIISIHRFSQPSIHPSDRPYLIPASPPPSPSSLAQPTGGGRRVSTLAAINSSTKDTPRPVRPRPTTHRLCLDASLDEVLVLILGDLSAAEDEPAGGHGVVAWRRGRERERRRGWGWVSVGRWMDASGSRGARQQSKARQGRALRCSHPTSFSHSLSRTPVSHASQEALLEPAYSPALLPHKPNQLTVDGLCGREGGHVLLLGSGHGCVALRVVCMAVAGAGVSYEMRR